MVFLMAKAARDILIYISPKRNVVAKEVIFMCGVCDRFPCSAGGTND